MCVDHLRTSEDERQRVVTFLRDCCADGYLEFDELGERQSHVLRSRTRGELATLVADLPGARAALPGVGAGAPPTFVRRRRAGAPPALAGMLALLCLLVLASGQALGLVLIGGFVLAVGVFGLIVVLSLSPWLAAGALIAWGVTRLRQPPAPPRLP